MRRLASDWEFNRKGWYPHGNRLHFVRGRYQTLIKGTSIWEWHYVSLCGSNMWDNRRIESFFQEDIPKAKIANCMTCDRLLNKHYASNDGAPPILCEAYDADPAINGWCQDTPCQLYDFTTFNRESMYLCQNHFITIHDWESSRRGHETVTIENPTGRV